MTAAIPLFAFEDVGVSTGDGTLLDRIDATLPDGGISVLLGPSGSGKSTLLRLCNRLEAPTRGRILFRGADLGATDPLAHRRRVGMVFQRPTPFGGTVRDNLLAAAPDAGDRVLLRALARAHLPGTFLERRAGELSGGESQRACLARTLVTDPGVLLLDEPTSALDEGARHALEGLALELSAEGVPIVWVTHDTDQAARLADWVLVLQAGRVRSCGPAGADARG